MTYVSISPEQIAGKDLLPRVADLFGAAVGDDDVTLALEALEIMGHARTEEFRLRHARLVDHHLDIR